MFSSEKLYSSHLTDCEDYRLEEILITENMLQHHVPWAVLNALQSLETSLEFTQPPSQKRV